MNYSTSALTTISSDTEPSFILTFDSAKYIFNAGENAGRSFRQNNRTWKKTEALFFTQSTIEKTGGLPGLLMTFADATINQLSIHGPDGLSHLLASMRMYSFRDSIRIKTNDIPLTSSPIPKPCFSDKNITVYAIPVLPIPPTPSLMIDEEDTTSVKLSEKRKRSPSPDAPRKKPNVDASSSVSVVLSSELQAEMQGEDFQPLSLTGSLAQEYRQLVLHAMFPYTNPSEEPKVKNNGKKGTSKGKAGKSEVKEASDDQPPRPASPATSESVKPRRVRLPPPKGFHQQLPKHINSVPSSLPPTVSYLILGPPTRGKFDSKKAAELGVFGNNRAKLVNGNPVEVEIKDGDQIIKRTVRPEEVLGKPEPAAVVAVFDIPSPDYIPSLSSNFGNVEFYQRFWGENPSLRSKDHIVRTVYHLLGDGVLEDERYKQFMHGFGDNVHHLVASREHNPDPLTFTSAGYNQLRLNKLDETMFPIPKHSMVPKKPISSIPGLPALTEALSAHHHVQLRPYAPPVRSKESEALDKFHPTLTGEVPLSISPSLQACIDQAKEDVAKSIANGDVVVPEGADVGIYPLGTGGSLPSKYRNVLSTLIRIPNWGNIILDCGEGTWGQMARHFGTDASTPDNAWDMLRDVKCIFASHIHGDHHMGLSQLLSKRKQLNPPPSHPLYVVSIRGVHLYLREVSDVQDIGLNDPSGNGVISVISDALHHQRSGAYMPSGLWQVGGTESWLDYDLSIKNANDMCKSLGLRSFTTVDVFHRCKCYGAVIRHNDGWSITFSGDTQPTKTLSWAGAKSTVLIHEATMADEEVELAKKKSHSTIGQAIDVGKQMKAKNILLTHFSARHPKMPPSVIEQEKIRSKDDPVVAPAFDLTSLTIGSLWKMKHYLPALEKNFDDTKDQDEEVEGEGGVREALAVNVSMD